MMRSADLQRLTRDFHAGCIANDNQPDRYDDSEGLDEWMRDTKRSLLRGLGYAAYVVAVLAMMVVAFRMGAGL